MSSNRCQFCGGRIDEFFECVRCGEVSEPADIQAAKKMKASRQDEQRSIKKPTKATLV